MNPSKILPFVMAATLLSLRSEAQEAAAGKLAPNPQAIGNAPSPPDSKPIPVGVGKWNPAPHPYPSEFAKPPVEFRLWENGGAPGNPEPLHGGQNTDNKGGIAQWGIPSIVVWEPLKVGTNRPAFMICPGGAYQNICTDWRVRTDGFLQKGFVVFMLKYRTVPSWKDCEKYALLDAKRGIRFIRTYAAHYGIDPDRIGAVGGSAGANLVLNLITHPDAGNPKDEDILERPGCQVAFAAMLCPWPTPANRPVSFYPISKDTPPAFIASAKDDTGAPTSWAVAIADTYEKVGVPHLFWQIDKGGHAAFSAETPDAEGYPWPTKFVEWLGKVLPDRPE
jgi:predicted esterase